MSVSHLVILNHKDDSFIQRILISFLPSASTALDVREGGENRTVTAPALSVRIKRAGCHDGERLDGEFRTHRKEGKGTQAQLVRRYPFRKI